MMYKRYREESDAAKMVGSILFRSFRFHFLAITSQICSQEKYLKTHVYPYIFSFSGGGRESIETTEKNIGSSC